MAGYGWIGGIIDLLGGIGQTYESSRLGETMADTSKELSNNSYKLAQVLKSWAVQDLERTKEFDRQVSGSYIDAVNRPVDYAAAEAKQVAPITQQASIGMRGARSRGEIESIGASSGLLSAIGRTAGRADADTKSWNTRARAGSTYSGIPASNTRLMTGQIDSLYRAADMFAGRTAQQADRTGDAYSGLFKAVGENVATGAKAYKSWSAEQDAAAAARASKEGGEAMGGEWYADGGVVEGPGTGRSDSVPAVIDGQAPARVSNGEYVIKGDVAKRIGLQRLHRINAMYR